jgi:hypothetical protein
MSVTADRYRDPDLETAWVQGRQWLSQALCSHHPWPGLWTDHSTDSPEGRLAARLCHLCPVMQACRSWALLHETPPEREVGGGIWGGLDYRQRLRSVREKAGVLESGTKAAS